MLPRVVVSGPECALVTSRNRQGFIDFSTLTYRQRAVLGTHTHRRKAWMTPRQYRSSRMYSERVFPALLPVGRSIPVARTASATVSNPDVCSARPATPRSASRSTSASRARRRASVADDATPSSTSGVLGRREVLRRGDLLEGAKVVQVDHRLIVPLVAWSVYDGPDAPLPVSPHSPTS
jgi:hypothetical protein